MKGTNRFVHACGEGFVPSVTEQLSLKQWPCCPLLAYPWGEERAPSVSMGGLGNGHLLPVTCVGFDGTSCCPH